MYIQTFTAGKERERQQEEEEEEMEEEAMSLSQTNIILYVCLTEVRLLRTGAYKGC